MDDGGLVVISAPANPYRCPPGPYERASLIAYWLKIWKPKSKLLILDAKDAFSKQRLFQNAWAQLYPGIIEWVSLSQGGKVTSVDPATLTVMTDFDRHKAAVANVIPPQKAGAIAAQAGVADRTGWCPVEPVAFESTLQPGIHVLGDAAIMGGMPKSAFAANAQAKVCAAAIVELLAGRKPVEPHRDQHLLQPGGARLRHLDRRRLSAREGACWPTFPAPAASARSRSSAASAPRRRSTPRAGSGRSPPRPSAEAMLRAGLLVRPRWLLAVPAARAQDGPRNYVVVGDAIPESLTVAAGRCGAWPGDRRQPQRRALPAVPQRPDPRGALPGHPVRPASPAPARAGRRASSACASSMARVSIQTRSCRPITGPTGLQRVAKTFDGKTILTAEQIEDVVAYLATLKE